MPVTATKSNRLRRRLCTQIIDYMRTAGLEAGTHLTTSSLASQLKVSRTPIRAALGLLAEEGILEVSPNRGFFIRKAVRSTEDIPEVYRQTEEERLYMAIAEDRMRNTLPDEVSELQLLRQYKTNRGALTAVLQTLSREGLAYSKQGHGWVFDTVLNSKEAYAESYNLRKIIEPAGIQEATFKLAPEQAKMLRREHHELLQKKSVTAADIFEVNAKFHYVLARCSGNRFIAQAIEQQNRLRRFVEYSHGWDENPELIQRVCEEHMAILDALENADHKRAANLMWQHLDDASRIRKDDAIALQRWADWQSSQAS